MGRVSIVLITFNSAPFLPRCLSGIQQQTHRDVELITLDNASHDGSVAALRAAGIDPIVNETNRGFAAGANQGIAASSGDYVLLLNPDVFMEPGYISTLVAALQERDEWWGAATGKLLRGIGPKIQATRAVDSKGIRMTRSGRHFDITDEPDEDVPVEVFGVSGAAALFRRQFLRNAAVAGEVFDEDFFAYREDADLAWRGRLFGYRALYVPAAIAYHVRRVTPEVRRSLPPEINYHSVKNRFLLRLKNQGPLLALRDAPFLIARDLLVFLATLTVERSSFPVWRWLWRNRKRIALKRREIQKRRRVSDRALASWFR